MENYTGNIVTKDDFYKLQSEIRDSKHEIRMDSINNQHSHFKNSMLLVSIIGIMIFFLLSIALDVSDLKKQLKDQKEEPLPIQKTYDSLSSYKLSQCSSSANLTRLLCYGS